MNMYLKMKILRMRYYIYEIFNSIIYKKNRELKENKRKRSIFVV